MKIPERALFIQLRRIGDVLMCTPAIRAFKSVFPKCQLDFLTEMPEVLKGNPHLQAIINVDPARQSDPVYQFNLLRKIRRGKYDLTVDFFANPRSAYYAFFSRAATRLSYGFSHRRWAYNLVPKKVDHPLYAAFDRLRLLEAAGINSDDPRLEFYPSTDDCAKAQNIIRASAEKPVISISPVSRKEYRRWPLENYARICDLLSVQYDVNIFVIAGPGEEKYADEVARMADIKPSVLHIENLGTLGAIFKNVGLHIGNDNGPKHIAVACGAPTFSIYGPESPVSWTYPDYSRHHWIQAREFCEKCQQIKNNCDAACIKSITVEAAWEKINDMIRTLPSFQSAVKKA